MDQTRQLIKDTILGFDGIEGNQFYNKRIKTDRNIAQAREILPLVKACFRDNDNASRVGRISNSTNVPRSLINYVMRHMEVPITRALQEAGGAV